MEIYNILIDNLQVNDSAEISQMILSSIINEDDYYEVIIKRINSFFAFQELNENTIKPKLKIIKNLLEKEKDVKGIDDECWGSEEMVEFILSSEGIFKYILENNKKSIINTSFGDKILTSGENILIMLEIFILLIEMNHIKINEYLLSKNFLCIINKIFEDYPWNSFLHNFYTIFVETILKSSLKYFIIGDLAKLVLKYCFNPDTLAINCIGLLGHCWKIANLLWQSSTDDEEIQKILQNIDSWGLFIIKLHQKNALENTEIF